MNDKTAAAGGNAPAERKRVQEHVLIEPIEGNDGAWIDRVTVRRPKGRDLREMEEIVEAKGPGPATFAMIAALTGLTAEQVDDLDAEDIVVLGEIVSNFMPARITGGQ